MKTILGEKVIKKERNKKRNNFVSIMSKISKTCTEKSCQFSYHFLCKFEVYLWHALFKNFE